MEPKLEYKKTIRDFGDLGGSTLYRQIIIPYVSACLKNGLISQADEGIHFAEARMTIDPTTQLGLDFIDLKNKVAEQKAAASPR